LQFAKINKGSRLSLFLFVAFFPETFPLENAQSNYSDIEHSELVIRIKKKLYCLLPEVHLSAQLIAPYHCDVEYI